MKIHRSPEGIGRKLSSHTIIEDNGYDAKTIFKERLCDINKLIRTSRIEDMYEEGAGRWLEGDICRMVESR